MQDGYVHLYRTGWSSEQVAERIAAVEAAGGTLEYPDTGLIFAGEFDDRNEPIPADRDDVVRALALSDRDSQFVSFWLGTPNPLWYTVSRVSPDVVLEDFRIAGFRQPEPFVHSGHVPEMTQDEVIHLVLGWMRELGSEAVGLLVDRWGSSLEIDVDDVVLGGPTPVTIRPDLVVLRPEVADLHPELADWGRRTYGRFVAFDPTGILDRT